MWSKHKHLSLQGINQGLADKKRKKILMEKKGNNFYFFQRIFILILGVCVDLFINVYI